MISVTLKDIPPRLHRELKSRAEANGRSLNSEIITCLQGLVQSTRLDVDSLLAEARTIRSTVRIRLTAGDLEAQGNRG